LSLVGEAEILTEIISINYISDEKLVVDGRGYEVAFGIFFDSGVEGSNKGASSAAFPSPFPFPFTFVLSLLYKIEILSIEPSIRRHLPLATDDKSTTERRSRLDSPWQ